MKSIAEIFDNSSFTFFSDFVIFQVVKWMFLIFHDVSHFP